MLDDDLDLTEPAIGTTDVDDVAIGVTVDPALAELVPARIGIDDGVTSIVAALGGAWSGSSPCNARDK